MVPNSNAGGGDGLGDPYLANVNASLILADARFYAEEFVPEDR